MRRSPHLFLDDILESIALIERYTQGVTKAAFLADVQLQDAVIRRLEIIGVAIRHLPDELRAQHPAVPWRQIVAMRNILSHEYFGIRLEEVWRVVERDLAELKAEVTEAKRVLA